MVIELEVSSLVIEVSVTIAAINRWMRPNIGISIDFGSKDWNCFPNKVEIVVLSNLTLYFSFSGNARINY